MIRPWNCASRRRSSLDTVVMSATSDTFDTVAPVITIEPVTSDVRPTASLCWPNSTSLTR
jgi:hypothetical protein